MKHFLYWLFFGFCAAFGTLVWCLLDTFDKQQHMLALKCAAAFTGAYILNKY